MRTTVTNFGELDVFAEPRHGDTFTFTDTFLEGGDGDKLFDVDVLAQM